MGDPQRIEDLRRRLLKDPASIAFAQLAEEYRRAGQLAESVATCRAGLALHPAYHSARVTLARALMATGELDAARLEFETILDHAPENLAAIRGLAEIHHKRGEFDHALRRYRSALSLARNDPEIEHAVEGLAGRGTSDPPSIALLATEPPEPAGAMAAAPPITSVPREDTAAADARPRAARVVAALERFRTAIYVARTYSRA